MGGAREWKGKVKCSPPLQMPEEEAFCVLVQLMSKYKMREVYKPSMADLSLCFYQLEKVIEVSPSYSRSCDHLWVWFIAGALPHPVHAFQGCGKCGGKYLL